MTCLACGWRLTTIFRTEDCDVLVCERCGVPVPERPGLVKCATTLTHYDRNVLEEDDIPINY